MTEHQLELPLGDQRITSFTLSISPEEAKRRRESPEMQKIIGTMRAEVAKGLRTFEEGQARMRRIRGYRPRYI